MPGDTNRNRVLQRYVEGDKEQPDTGRFPVVERPAFYPIERPLCQEHSGVCVEIKNLKDEVAAIKAHQSSNKAFWFALVAAALGSAAGAAVAFALGGAGG